MDSFNQDDIKFKKTNNPASSKQNEVKKEEAKEEKPRPGSLWNGDNKVKTDKTSVFGENDTEDNEFDFDFNSDGKVDEDEAEVFNMYKKIEKKEIKIDGNWGDLTKIKELTKKDFDIDGDGKVSKEELKEVFEFLTVKSKNKEISSANKASQNSKETDYEKLIKAEKEILIKIENINKEIEKASTNISIRKLISERSKLEHSFNSSLGKIIKPQDYSNDFIKGDFDERKDKICNIYINSKLKFKKLINNAKTPQQKEDYEKLQKLYFEKLIECYKNYSTYMKDEFEERIKFFSEIYSSNMEKGMNSTLDTINKENNTIKQICGNDENKIQYFKKLMNFMKLEGGSAQYDKQIRADFCSRFEVMLREGKSLEEIDAVFKKYTNRSLYEIDLNDKSAWDDVCITIKANQNRANMLSADISNFHYLKLQSPIETLSDILEIKKDSPLELLNSFVKDVGIENPDKFMEDFQKYIKEKPINNFNELLNEFQNYSKENKQDKLIDLIDKSQKTAKENGYDNIEEYMNASAEKTKKAIFILYGRLSNVKLEEPLSLENKILLYYQARLNMYTERKFNDDEIKDDTFIKNLAENLEELKKANNEKNIEKFWKVFEKLSNKPVNKKEIENLINSYKDFQKRHKGIHYFAQKDEYYTQAEALFELVPVAKRLSELFRINNEEKFIHETQNRKINKEKIAYLDSLCKKYGDFEELLKKHEEEEKNDPIYNYDTAAAQEASYRGQRRLNTEFLRDNLLKMKETLEKNPDMDLTLDDNKEFFEKLKKIECIDKDIYIDYDLNKKNSLTKKVDEYNVDINKPFVLTQELREKMHNRGNVDWNEGISDHALEAIPFAGSIISISNSVDLINIANELKANKGDVMSLSPIERKKLYGFFIELAETNLRDTTIMGMIGSGLPGSFAFLVEMAVTMGVLGISEAGSKTAAELAKEGTKKGAEFTAKSILKEGGKKLVNQVPKVLLTSAAMPQRYIDYALKRQYSMNVDENGQWTLNRTGESMVKSLALGYFDTVIEVGTEFMVGDAMTTLTKAAQVKLFGKVLELKVLSKFYNNPLIKAIGLHGLYEEMAEEYAANFLRAVFKLEGDPDKTYLQNIIDSVLLDKKKFLALAGTIIAQPIVISPTVYIQRCYTKSQLQATMKNMPAKMFETMLISLNKGGRAEILDILNNLDDEEFSEVKKLLKEGKEQGALDAFKKKSLENMKKFLKEMGEEFGINENNSKEFLEATSLLKTLLGEKIEEANLKNFETRKSNIINEILQLESVENVQIDNITKNNIALVEKTIKYIKDNNLSEDFIATTFLAEVINKTQKSEVAGKYIDIILSNDTIDILEKKQLIDMYCDDISKDNINLIENLLNEKYNDAVFSLISFIINEVKNNKKVIPYIQKVLDNNSIPLAIKPFFIISCSGISNIDLAEKILETHKLTVVGKQMIILNLLKSLKKTDKLKANMITSLCESEVYAPIPTKNLIHTIINAKDKNLKYIQEILDNKNLSIRDKADIAKTVNQDNFNINIAREIINNDNIDNYYKSNAIEAMLKIDKKHIEFIRDEILNSCKIASSDLFQIINAMAEYLDNQNFINFAMYIINNDNIPSKYKAKIILYAEDNIDNPDFVQFAKDIVNNNNIPNELKNYIIAYTEPENIEWVKEIFENSSNPVYCTLLVTYLQKPERADERKYVLAELKKEPLPNINNMNLINNIKTITNSFSDINPAMIMPLVNSSFGLKRLISLGKSLVKEFPEGTSKVEALEKTKIGDVIQLNNQLYINEGRNLYKYDMTKEAFDELFPPLESLYISQGNIGNCHFIAKLVSLMNNPLGRIHIYKSFKQKGNDIICTIRAFKNYGGSKTYKNGELPKLKERVTACKGIQILEQTYANVAFKSEGVTNNDLENLKRIHSSDAADDAEGFSDLIGCEEVFDINESDFRHKTIVVNAHQTYIFKQQEKLKELLLDRKNCATVSFSENIERLPKYKDRLITGHEYSLYISDSGEIYIINPHNSTRLICKLTFEELLEISDLITICNLEELSVNNNSQ